MNDDIRRRNIELAALAAATDDQGRVDLSAFEAQRLVLTHQKIDGIDADALVRELTSSPAYRQAPSGEQIEPLLAAIGSRLAPAEVARYRDALDRANVNESAINRFYEDYLETPAAQAYAAAGRGLGWTDQAISDTLRDTRRWAEGIANDDANSGAARVGAWAVGALAEQSQENYGVLKGASRQALSAVGDVVDVGQMAYRFSTDSSYRDLIIGSAQVYAAQVLNDPSKPLTDAQRAAGQAWEQWKQGLDQARQQGKESEYLGEAKGAAGFEILSMVVPAGALVKAAKLGKLADAVAEHAPDSPAGRQAAGELAEAMGEAVAEARDARTLGPFGADSADRLYEGMAGVRRTQGELDTVLDAARAGGDMDGLLRSGALHPKELNYLARTDIGAFDGNVPFHEALDAWSRRRDGNLTSTEVGDIGEALTAHTLMRSGHYRDVMPIQNNSGHGSDLVAFNTERNRTEVFEIKGSLNGIAKGMQGDAAQLTLNRLQRAAGETGHWDPANVWEAGTAERARELLKDLTDERTGRLDIDANWARVNFSRDPDTGALSVLDPKLDPWQIPSQRSDLDAAAPVRHAAASVDAAPSISANDQSMFARIRESAPAVGEDAAWLAVREAKRNGIDRPEQIGTVASVGDKLWVAGATPGFVATVDLAARIPPAQETQNELQRAQRDSTQQAALAAEQQQTQPSAAMRV